jgi:hypothetical protein
MSGKQTTPSTERVGSRQVQKSSIFLVRRLAIRKHLLGEANSAAYQQEICDANWQCKGYVALTPPNNE